MKSLSKSPNKSSVKDLVDKLKAAKLKKIQEFKAHEEQVRVQEIQNSVSKSIGKLINSFEKNAFKLSDSNKKVAEYIAKGHYIITTEYLFFIALNKKDKYNSTNTLITDDAVYIKWRNALENKFGFKLHFKEINTTKSYADGNYTIDYVGIEAVFYF